MTSRMPPRPWKPALCLAALLCAPAGAYALLHDDPRAPTRTQHDAPPGDALLMQAADAPAAVDGASALRVEVKNTGDSTHVVVLVERKADGAPVIAFPMSLGPGSTTSVTLPVSAGAYKVTVRHTAAFGWTTVNTAWCDEGPVVGRFTAHARGLSMGIGVQGAACADGSHPNAEVPTGA